MNDDVECPYCGARQDINHDDVYGYSEDLHQQECHECDKTFTFSTGIIYCYEAFKADCLNGYDHDWKPSNTFPKFFTKMRCKMCEEQRDPTDEERQQHGIPMTYED
jgi:hypothetical protein